MGAPTSTAFIQAVMARLDADGATDLAKRMGWADYNAPNNIGRWIRGTSAPSYEATLEMLEKAGWLTEDAQERLGMAKRKLTAARGAAARAAAQARHLPRQPPDSPGPAESKK